MLTPQATASLPKVCCYEHGMKSFLSYFLGKICRYMCNFWYNRETPPFFQGPNFRGHFLNNPPPFLDPPKVDKTSACLKLPISMAPRFRLMSLD